MKKEIIIALIGNPNCGKTTLFNRLTHGNQKVGNWTGVTVEKKEGKYYKDDLIKIIDLPGTYSLSPYSEEERVVEKFLKNTPPDAVINVVDGTNLERNLYLTFQLAALNVPTVIAVNMKDDMKKNGIKIDVNKLSSAFNMPVIEISAVKDKDFNSLINLANTNKTLPKLFLTEKEDEADKIYTYIEGLIKDAVTIKETKGQVWTKKLDNILTHKVLGPLIFVAVTFLVYFISIKIGKYISDAIALGFIRLGRIIEVRFNDMGVKEWLTGLVVGALIGGVGSVLSFLPQILLLFLLTSLLESCGYMARVAFIFDGLLKHLGLSGKSVIPLIISSGCIVSGVYATRIIENADERKATVYLSAFMPCSAKLEVFIGMSGILFGGSALVATSCYFLSILAVIVGALTLKRFKRSKKEEESFILELPIYRLPRIKESLKGVFKKAKSFVIKAGTTIFLLSLALWILKSFGKGGYVGDNVENSILSFIGKGIKYFFYPIGVTSWEASVSALTGFFAKEQVFVTLNALKGSGGVATLFNGKASAYSFMVFILLSAPCVAAVSAMKRELGTFKELIKALLFETGFAYATAVIIYGLFLSTITRMLILFIPLTYIIYKTVKAPINKSKRIIKSGR